MESSLSRSSKKHSTKEAVGETPFDLLCDFPEQINPAIILAEELMRKAIGNVLEQSEIENAEEVLVISTQEIKRIDTQFAALVKTPASASLKIPIGF
jgi:hypothetical protein